MEDILHKSNNIFLKNLEIQAVLLDEIIQSPENPSLDFIVKLETKSLRDTRQLLEKVNIGEAIKFINDNPHPRLSYVFV